MMAPAPPERGGYREARALQNRHPGTADEVAVQVAERLELARVIECIEQITEACAWRRRCASVAAAAS